MKGDAAKAFSAISRSKDKAPESVDYWEAFVRIWRANGKPEKTLWETIIAKRREANPGSRTFDLVAARLETDAAKRRVSYEAAVKKDPKCLEARLGLARTLVAEGKDDEAEDDGGCRGHHGPDAGRVALREQQIGDEDGGCELEAGGDADADALEA